MKFLSKKYLLMAVFMGASSFILASSYFDMQLQSTAFMNEVEIESIQRLDDITERYVASEEIVESSPKVISCPDVETPDFLELKENVIGMWEIHKFKELKNNHMNEEEFDAEVKIEMSKNCQVMVNEDSNQVFEISFLSESKTMAIFKLFNSGYQILELKKIHEVMNDKISVSKVEVASEEKAEKLEVLEVSEHIELALFSAKTNKGMLDFEQVEGSLEIIDGVVTLEATLNYKNGNVEKITVSDGEKSGNSFIADDENDPENKVVAMVQGSVESQKYAIRFVSPGLKGVVLDFASDEKIEEARYAKEEREMFQDELINEKVENKKEDNEEVVLDDNEEEEESEDREVMREVAQERGFEF